MKIIGALVACCVLALSGAAAGEEMASPELKQVAQSDVTAASGPRSCTATSEDGKKSCSVSCQDNQSASCTSGTNDVSCTCN